MFLHVSLCDRCTPQMYCKQVLERETEINNALDPNPARSPLLQNAGKKVKRFSITASVYIITFKKKKGKS